MGSTNGNSSQDGCKSAQWYQPRIWKCENLSMYGWTAGLLVIKLLCTKISYSKIVQSEQSIYLTQCSHWLLLFFF